MSTDLIDSLITHLKNDYDAFIMLQSKEDYDGNLKKMSDSFGFEYINKENLLNVVFAFLVKPLKIAYNTKTDKFKGSFIKVEGTFDLDVYRPVFINLVKDKRTQVVSNEDRYNLAPRVNIYDIEALNEEDYDILCLKLEDLFNPLNMRNL